MQELIADIGVELEAARFLTWRAAALADAGERHTLESSVAKYYASEASVRAANAAVQVHGGYGYVDEYPVGKYLRDARVTTLYEGTSQVQKLIIGRAPQVVELLGEDQMMASADIPHGEARERSMDTLRDRSDLSERTKKKILGENAARFYDL